MLELFYSTGVRLSELAGLNDADVDLVSDQAKVRGKGKKERLVPVGRHAGRALRAYYRHPDALAPSGTADPRAAFVDRRRRRPTLPGGQPPVQPPVARPAPGPHP